MNRLADLTRVCEEIDALAAADLFRTAPDVTRAQARVRLEWASGAPVCIAPAVDVLAFNRVVGLGIMGTPTEADVDRMVEHYRSAGARRFMVQLAPGTDPAVERWLRTRGFAHHNNWAKLYRSAERLPPPGGALRVEVIGTERAELFAAIAVESFAWPEILRPWFAAAVGHPGWRHYLALDRGAAVGAAALFFQGETGWLGFAATLPTARGRGAQTALITRRLHDGAALGCRWFVVETAEDRPDKPSPSYRNVRRLGFEMAYLRPNRVLSWSAPGQ